MRKVPSDGGFSFKIKMNIVQKRRKRFMQAIFETLFDIAYLVTVITLGILMIRGSRGRKQ